MSVTERPPRPRDAAHHAFAVVLYARHRPLNAALVVVALVGLVLSAGSSLPALFEDPTIPRPRGSLAIGCLLSALVVLLTRPVLPDAERLAAISVGRARLVLAAAFVALMGLASALCLLMDDPVLAWRCVTVGGALTGLGLLAARVGTFWGLVVPSAYVMAGLSLGYQAELGLGWAIQPWAWLVDQTVPVGYELALLLVGLASMVVPPRAVREP